MLKRLFALFLAFLVLCFCPISAFATDSEAGGIPVQVDFEFDVVDFFDSLDVSFRNNLRGYSNFAWHLIQKDVCPYAPTLGGGHSFVAKHTLKHGQVGMYYVCEYCDRAYGDMLEEKYEEYVQETFEDKLSTKVDNNGNIPVSSPLFYFNRFEGRMDYITAKTHERGIDFSVSMASPVDRYFSLSVRPGRLLLMGNGGEVSLVTGTHRLYVDFVAPCDGILVVPPTTVTLSYVPGSLSHGHDDPAFSCLSGVFSGNFPLLKGQVPAVCFNFSTQGLGSQSWRFPISRESDTIPANSIVCEADFSSAYIEPSYVDETVYAAENRVAGASVNNSGLYGYVENGQLVQSGTNTIFTESGNVYTNPVTGDTSNVTNWQYDYSDRSYKLTTEEGDTVTVTYGDSNVTINEGGTTYNVYYLMSEEGVDFSHDHTHTPASSEVTLAPTCTGTGVKTNTCSECGMAYTEIIPATGHSYSSAVTMPPTCANTGVRTFTCANCGDTYTVSIAATGHTWEVVRNVSTEFDENGQLVREGYTLYQCSVCGEQYKITADTGGASLPSPSSDGTSTGNTDLVELDSSVGRGFLATIAHGLTEDLPAVLQACSQWFTEFPRFYSGFVAFLTDGVFSCYPAEYKLMMSFGIGMVTIIGIVRKILGR